MAGDAARVPIGADLELLLSAAAVAVKAGSANPAQIQRHVRVGFAKAARLVDLLEQEGVVGPRLASGRHRVLVGLDEALERIRKAAEGEDGNG